MAAHRATPWNSETTGAWSRSGLKKENRMAAGKLKMWNADRGFGFIKDENGGPDTFLHINELKAAGIDPDRIKVGDRLTFETASTRDGRTKASNVRMA